jgi:phosphatidylglycerophosphate synthase
VPVTALNAWLRTQSLAWLPVCAWLLATAPPSGPNGLLLAGGIGLSFVLLVGLLRAGRRIADVATIARLSALAVLVATAGPAATLGWWCAAVAVVFADLLDGALARRFGGSEAGAVLDMEADQLVVFGLAATLVRQGGGVHVLALPAMRWAFVLASWWLGIPAHEPKPVEGDNRRGRLVCAAVMVALLLALAPGVPRMAGDVATAVAVLLLGWSFSGDARHLLARRSTRSVA